METYLGFAAAFCTTIAFIPQAIKVCKTKHTKDISITMFLLMNFWNDIVFDIWTNNYVLSNHNCKYTHNYFDIIHFKNKN